jgi:hypothetical protein
MLWWKVVRDVLSVHEAQAVVGCIFPRKDPVLGRPLRCEPVCVVPVPNLGEVYVLLFMYCVVAVRPAGKPRKMGNAVMHLHHDAPK